MKTAAKPKAEPHKADTYDAWKLEQIRLGLDDIEAGRIISNEEVERRSAAHLKRLAKKYDKAA